MKYIRLENNKVVEILQEIDPIFPKIPINERYPQQFIDELLKIEEDVQVQENWIYNAETSTFSEPPTPKPNEPINVNIPPTQAELLKQENSELSDAVLNMKIEIELMKGGML